MSNDILVSVIVVTEDRPAFMPWLVWNYCKQTFPLDQMELIVVDSSYDRLPLYTALLDGARVPWPGHVGGRQVDFGPVNPASAVNLIDMPHGTPVPVKWNKAIAAARGKYIVFFGDDDWQHPRKVELGVAAMTQITRIKDGNEIIEINECDLDFVGWSACGLYATLYGTGIPQALADPSKENRIKVTVQSSVTMRTDFARAHQFQEEVKKAADAVWMDGLQGKIDEGLETAAPGVKWRVLPDFDHAFWIQHPSNAAGRVDWPVPGNKRGLLNPPNMHTRGWLYTADHWNAFKARQGKAGWLDTDAQMSKLRQLLGLPKMLAMPKGWNVPTVAAPEPPPFPIMPAC